MVRIKGDIIISRSVEDVFDFVADERNRYDPRIRRAEKLTDGPIGVGTRFRSESTSMGRTVEMEIEITEYDRPRRLGSSTQMSPHGDPQHLGLRGRPRRDPHEVGIGSPSPRPPQGGSPARGLDRPATGSGHLGGSEAGPGGLTVAGSVVGRGAGGLPRPTPAPVPALPRRGRRPPCGLLGAGEEKPGDVEDAGVGSARGWAGRPDSRDLVGAALGGSSPRLTDARRREAPTDRARSLPRRRPATHARWPPGRTRGAAGPRCS